ncbi:MAG: diguanylate cyclase [Acidobacteriota bacterium]|jgi:diguanylate cyclase (GGDEF)-like protein|nr:MAG: hypothetical protein DIU54_05365 [Acidobacteriota bacterium]
MEIRAQTGIRLPDGADPAPPADALATFVDRLLSFLVDMAPRAERADVDRFRIHIESCRGALKNPDRRGDLPRIIDSCITACETHFRLSERYYELREQEFSEIIAILREAARIAVGDSSDFHTRMVEATERFSRLGELEDLRELKHRLSAEVHVLRRTVDEKLQRDQRAYIQLIRRVDSLQARLAQIEEEVSLDPLTRVGSRRGFDRTVARMAEQARQQQVALSVAMFEVDDFALIVETHGRTVADRVLLCAAQWLTRGLRQSDYVARYADQFFAALLPATPAAQVEMRLRQLLAEIARSAYEYELLGRRERVRFTISCGLTELQDGDTVDTLVARADDALADARRRGPGRLGVRKRSALKALLSWA